MNDYFEHATKLMPGTKARAEDVNSRFDAVVTGFDKLPGPHPSLLGFADPVAVGTPTLQTHAVSAGAAMGGGLSYAADIGAANAYVVNLDIAPPSYRDGLTISFKALNPNSGASTINVNGLGIKQLVRSNGDPVASGDITAGQTVTVIYNGTKFLGITPFQGQLNDIVALSSDSAAAASASAGTANTQAGIATTQAGIATTKAGEASASAGTATTQAGIATTQAGIATSEADRAESAADAAAITLSSANLDNKADKAGTLAQFAATTSLQLKTLLTDETGSGAAVFANSPTLVTPNLGAATGTSFNSITGLSSTTPLVDGTAAVGNGTTAARGNHVHPTDTSRLAANLKDASGGFAGLTLLKINFKNALNTITSFLTNANTAARTYTFQNRDGVIADDTDLALKAPLNSANLTGTPQCPTAAVGTNTPQIANCAFVLANAPPRVEVVTGFNGKLNIVGFDVWNSDVNQITVSNGACLDSNLTRAFDVSVNTVINLDTTPNKPFHLFVVHVISGDVDTVRAYDTFAAPASDVTIDRYAPLDYWQNNGSGAVKAGFSKNGIHWWAKSSEAAVNSKVAPPAGCSTPVDISDFLPDESMVSEVLMGGQCSGSNQQIILGFDGTNGHHTFYTSVNTITDNDINAWCLFSSADRKFMPIKNSTIYWGDGGTANASTADLRLQAVRLRR